MKKTIVLGIVLAFVAMGCSENQTDTPTTKPNKTNNTQPAAPAVKIPDFNAENAYNYIKTQVEFGPRVPNSPEHKECASWMVEEFKKLNLKVTEQKFQATAYDNTVLNLNNIIVEHKPEKQNRILLAAHWDSRHIAENDTEKRNSPIDGANDGASGVGVLMEIARVISETEPNIGIDIILFDGEDYGQPNDSELPPVQDSWCLGSQYWSKNKHRGAYYPRYGILLDMVGAKDAKFSKDAESMYFAKNVVDKIWSAGQSLGYGSYFTPIVSDQIIDDHYYVNRIAQIPMADIIQHDPHSSNGTYFGDYHHTHNDNLDGIDQSTLKAVGQTLLKVIYTEK